MPNIFTNIDYDSHKLVHPTYVYQQIPPLNSQTQVEINNTGGFQSQFKLPPQSVYNLSKSYIEFDFVPPAGGGANAFN